MLQRTLRLYKAEDLSLLILYLNDKNFGKKAAKILSDFANGSVSLYPIDDIELDCSKVFLDENIKKYKMTYLHIYFNKDTLAGYELTKSVCDGFIGDFIKNVIKKSIPDEVLNVYINQKFIKKRQSEKTKTDNTINPIEIKEKKVANKQVTKKSTVKIDTKQTEVKQENKKEENIIKDNNNNIETDENNEISNNVFSMFSSLAQNY